MSRQSSSDDMREPRRSDEHRRAENAAGGFHAGRGRRKKHIADTLDHMGDVMDRHMEKSDPIYTEPIHKSDRSEPTADDTTAGRVLVKGRIDPVFLLIVLTLTVFGAIMAYSASSVYAAQEHGDSAYFFKKHLLYLAIAFVVAGAAVVFGRPWFWRFFGVASYGVSVVLLLLVLVIGSSFGSGATRWIQIGPISVQPSEIAKMAVILTIALVMSKHEKEIRQNQKFGGHLRYGMILPMLIFGVICVLVLLEKHLSGIIIIGLLGLVMMYLGGTNAKLFVGIFGALIAAVILLLLLAKPLNYEHALVRIDTWLNIDKVDPLGSAWQTLQGLYAIGSGGFFGKGLGNSDQKYGYVSQPQNDFIFTIVCEELGFIGALLVIVLFGLLVWRGFRIASKAPDRFCSLVVMGLVTKAALQAILNIAVVTNSMPNTGISLPFFSSGGTALILQLLEMGIVLSISRYSYQKE